MLSQHCPNIEPKGLALGVPGSVRGSVRPLRPLMLAASPEVLDHKIPFLCTRRGYFHALNMGGGRRAPYLVFPLAPCRAALFQAPFGGRSGP